MVVRPASRHARNRSSNGPSEVGVGLTPRCACIARATRHARLCRASRNGEPPLFLAVIRRWVAIVSSMARRSRPSVTNTGSMNSVLGGAGFRDLVRAAFLGLRVRRLSGRLMNGRSAARKFSGISKPGQISPSNSLRVSSDNFPRDARYVSVRPASCRSSRLILLTRRLLSRRSESQKRHVSNLSVTNSALIALAGLFGKIFRTSASSCFDDAAARCLVHSPSAASVNHTTEPAYPTRRRPRSSFGRARPNERTSPRLCVSKAARTWFCPKRAYTRVEAESWWFRTRPIRCSD